MERRKAGNARNKAITHGGSVIGFAVVHGNLGNHGVLRSQLVFAGIGHEHRCRADGGIKALHQPALSADLQAGQVFPEGLRQRLIPQHGGHLVAVIGAGLWGLYPHVGLLCDAVCVQEGARNIDDAVAAPGHAQARAFRDFGHNAGVQVLLGRLRDETVYICGSQHHSHALLAFGNCQLSAVQAFIFFRNTVELNGKAVRQLADGNADAACAKIVAALDELGNLRVAEQALQLALGRRVTLLNLRAANFNRLQGVRLAGARGAADAVAARGAAKQNHHVAGGGAFTYNIALWRGADYRADLQAFCHIAGVVELRDLSGGQADLVAVGAVALRGPCGDFA